MTSRDDKVKSPRQRILVITTSYPRRGDDSAGHFIATEVKELATQGHQLTVLVPGDTPFASESASAHEDSPLANVSLHFVGGSKLFAHPGALVRLTENPWRAFAGVLPTLRILTHRWRARSEPFDRIIAHFLVPSAFPWALFFSTSSALEAVAHGSDVQLLLRLPKPVRNLVLEFLERRGTQLRFVSEGLKQDLKQVATRTQWQRMVDAGEVKPSPLSLTTVSKRDDSRKQLGLGSTDRVGVLVGRLIESKRPAVALRAAALVPNLKMVVVGSGPLEEQLRREFPEAAFVGKLPHSEALTWICTADLLFSTSLNEGAPTVIREARAARIPVVARPSGDSAMWAANDPELWIVD